MSEAFKFDYCATNRVTFLFRLEREKAILVNEVALVQKERDDQLLMAENEKQEALHAAANEKGSLLDRLNKTQNDLENANVEIDRIKRDAFSRAEQDKVLSVCLSVCLFVRLSVCLSVCLSISRLDNVPCLDSVKPKTPVIYNLPNRLISIQL